jgi:hypothetical protein
LSDADADADASVKRPEAPADRGAGYTRTAGGEIPVHRCGQFDESRRGSGRCDTSCSI